MCCSHSMNCLHSCWTPSSSRDSQPPLYSERVWLALKMCFWVTFHLLFRSGRGVQSIWDLLCAGFLLGLVYFSLYLLNLNQQLLLSLLRVLKIPALVCYFLLLLGYHLLCIVELRLVDLDYPHDVRLQFGVALLPNVQLLSYEVDLISHVGGFLLLQCVDTLQPHKLFVLLPFGRIHLHLEVILLSHNMVKFHCPFLLS